MVPTEEEKGYVHWCDHGGYFLPAKQNNAIEWLGTRIWCPCVCGPPAIDPVEEVQPRKAVGHLG